MKELEGLKGRIAGVEKAKKEEAVEKEAAMVPVRKAEEALAKEESKAAKFESK